MLKIWDAPNFRRTRLRQLQAISRLARLMRHRWAAHRRLCGLFDDKKRRIAMKTWFTSLNGAITLSALALLSFIGYTFMAARYFLEKWIPGDGAAMVETIVLLLIIGGWLRALFVAAGGRRGGLTALFAFSVLITLIALYDMQFVLYAQISWPEQLMVVVMLIVGVIVTAAMGVHLRNGKKTA